MFMDDALLLGDAVGMMQDDNGNGNDEFEYVEDSSKHMFQAFQDDGGDADEDPLTIDPGTESALDSIAGTSTRQVSDSTHETNGGSPTTTTMTLASPSFTSEAEERVESETAAPHRTPEPLVLTGRPGIPLYLSCNPDHLSEYQCLIRKNMELFEATEQDVASRIKGRNKPIVLGQVGIRCCHCRFIPIAERERSSMYYPHTLVGIYQAAQILAQQHFLEACAHVPPHVRQELVESKTKKSFATAGKEYWAATAEALGVYEDQYGLRFEPRLGMNRKTQTHRH